MTTIKEGKKLAGMNTMSTGATPTKIEAGQSLKLHGIPVTVIVSDSEETVIAYSNRAQRTIDTADLNAYLDLGTFPTGTPFQRPTDAGAELAVILAVTGDCCYLVNIADPVTFASTPKTFTYAELLQWHMEGSRVQADLAPAGGQLYVPKVSATDEELAGDLDALKDPVPAQPDQTIAELEAALEALKTENFRLKTAIGRQADMHATVIAGYEEDIERLEAKAAILNPAPVCKEYCTRTDINESDLNKLAAAGWQIQVAQFVGDGLNVLLYRDIPQPAVGDTPRTAAAASPMPVTQTVVGLGDQSISRALTNNRPKPGDTRRIPTLAQFEERKQRNADEIAEIIERGAAKQEALRQQFANTPSPFQSLTGGQSS